MAETVTTAVAFARTTPSVRSRSRDFPPKMSDAPAPLVEGHYIDLNGFSALACVRVYVCARIPPLTCKRRSLLSEPARRQQESRNGTDLPPGPGGCNDPRGPVPLGANRRGNEFSPSVVGGKSGLARGSGAWENQLAPEGKIKYSADNRAAYRSRTVRTGVPYRWGNGTQLRPNCWGLARGGAQTGDARKIRKFL